MRDLDIESEIRIVLHEHDIHNWKRHTTAEELTHICAGKDALVKDLMALIEERQKQPTQSLKERPTIEIEVRDKLGCLISLLGAMAACVAILIFT